MTDQDNHWRWATPERALGFAPAAGDEGVTAGMRGLGGAPTSGLAGAGATSAGTGADVGGGAGAGIGAGVGLARSAAPTRLERWRDAIADRLPATLRGRWSLDRTTAVLLVVSVLLAALVLGGWTWLRDRPHELAVARTHPAAQSSNGGAAVPMPELPPPRADPAQPQSQPQRQPAAPLPQPLPQIDAGPPPAAGGTAGGVVVDVEGKVARPGVRTLPSGSRVIDAITAAGGALPGTDLTMLNQAQVLVDGQQILVGVSPPPNPGGVVPPGRGGGGKERKGAVAMPVRLNSASLTDLEQLPGVGPALAQRIVDYRTAHGPFRSVDELQQVSGFGGARFQTIEPFLAL